MDRNEIEAKKAQLLALLTEAGHFPRPRTIGRLRYIESEPGIYEGHDSVVLVPTKARVAAARGRPDGSLADRLRGDPNVRVTALLAASHEIEPLNDDGAKVIDEALDDVRALGGRAHEIVRTGEDFPRDWTAARRRGWKVDSRTPSPVDARIEKVADLRGQIEAIVVPLLRVGALPNPRAWQALIDDDLLDDDNRSAARESLKTKDAQTDQRTPFKVTTAPHDTSRDSDEPVPLREAARRVVEPLGCPPDKAHEVVRGAVRRRRDPLPVVQVRGLLCVRPSDVEKEVQQRLQQGRGLPGSTISHQKHPSGGSGRDRRTEKP